MSPPLHGRDGEGRCPSDQKQRPRPDNSQRTLQRQRAATPAITSMVARIGCVCDTLVQMASDAASLARRTDCAAHAEAACYLLDAVRLTWLASEALAGSGAVV
jgi:hypothetical protein